MNDSKCNWYRFPHVKNYVGSVATPNQQHFYMEPQSSIAIPQAAGELLMYVATQDQHLAQKVIAQVLGWQMHQIVIKTKRIGGGFGGKEANSYQPAMACAIAANKLGKPVSLILSRQEDCKISGGRHPYLVNYKVMKNIVVES